MDIRDILLTLDIYCEHDWSKMYKIITDKETDMLEDESVILRVEAEKYALLSKGYKVVVLTDPEYPDRISHSLKPPFVIYYKGNLDTVEDRYSYQDPDTNPKRMFVE